MKKLVLFLLILNGSCVYAQDYVVCNSYNSLGDFEKAKTCMAALKSKYPTDPAYFYYSVQQAITSGDAKHAEELMATVNNYPATDIHIYSAKTSYMVFKGEIAQAKVAYDGILKNHKTAPVPILLNVAGSFISFKVKDPDYTLLWINTLEKELKMPHPAWLMLKGDYYASIGDHGNALNFYNLVLDADVKNPIALFKKAVAYRRIKNPGAALTELESAIKIQPEFPLAILEKAEVLYELNRPDEGGIFYNAYFKMVPGDIPAHLQYGSSLFSAKKYAEAEKEADYVLALDSSSLPAMKLKGYSDYEMGSYQQGLDILVKYLFESDSSIQQSRDYEYLARYYQKMGGDSLSLEAFKNATIFPGYKSEIFTEAGGLLMKKGKYADAMIVYQHKLDQFALTSADYFNYGRAALASDSFLLADSLFAKVCEMQPTWPNGFLMRAQTNSHLDPGSTEGKALPYYEKFISLAEADTVNSAKLKSGLIEAYKYLAYYSYLNKDIEKSKTYWRKVLALDPDDKQAKDVLKQL